MIRFFHTADIHFGVENYGKIDPKTGIHSRLWDFKISLEHCIDLAITQNVDFFLFCGDAYKTAYPTPTQQRMLVTLFLRLQAAKIPVVVIVGNHDHPLSFGKSNSLDVFDYLPLDGFHVFSKPEIKTIETKSGPVQIAGIPWPTRNNLIAQDAHRFKSNTELTSCISEKVGQIISNFATQVDEKIPSVLAAHLTVSTGIFSGSEKASILGNDPVFLPSQLALPQFDYVALGHLHRYQDLNKGHSPSVVYPGSVERVDFGERKEDKGFCDVKIDVCQGQKKCHYDFIKLNTRPMLQIEVFLQKGQDQTEQILSELNKYDLHGAIVKIVYHISDGMTDKVDLFAVNRASLDAFCVIGIIPVHKPLVKEKRLVMSVDMDFDTIIKSYLQAKDLSQNKKDELMQKASAILSSLDNNITEGS